MSSIIITGGAGFIGSNFVRKAIENTDFRIIVFDKLTYAGRMENLAEFEGNPRFSFVKGDIANPNEVEPLFEDNDLAGILNFAAESHVDRSIDHPGSFIEANIVGTFVLLDASRRYFAKNRDRGFRFHHISTDEVYGTLGATGSFKEETPYSPNSPYSASKAGADHLVRAYFETYGLPAVISNCSNNYGPYQFPEKLIPLMILNALNGQELPIYGDGKNIRDWLYVEDHCEGILSVFLKGRVGQKYNIGGRSEKTNIDVVDSILTALEKEVPAKANPALIKSKKNTYGELKKFVQDRPGHDRRYAIDSTKIETELGWKPAHSFDTGIVETVRWYLKNREWCEAVQKENYSRERLGLGGASK